MSRRNFRQDLDYNNARGVDSTNPLPLLGPGFVRKAINANIRSDGGWEKRQGYAEQLSSSWTDMAIVQGIEFKTAAGSAEKILFGTDYTAAGGALGKIDSGSVTNIITGLEEDKRPSLFQFGDLLFFYNGDSVNSPFLYDGSGTRQIGIDPPSTAPGGTAGSGGSLTTGSYIAAYTYYNSTTKAESTPSSLSSAVVVTNPGQDKITWTLVAGDSSTADKIRIYRTVANGNTLFFDDEVDISATSFESTNSDASLSTTQIEFDNTRITTWDTAPEYPVVAQNRVFVKTAANEVRFSKIGQSGPMPESFEAKSFVKTEGRFGSRDDIIGLAQIKDVPLVLKDLSIGRLDQVGIQDYTTSIDNVAYIYREIDTNTGAVSHFGGAQVFDEYVFLGRDNIYATNGSVVRAVGDRISNTVKGLSFTPEHKAKISAVNDIDNKRLYISAVSQFAEGIVDIVLVGDYHNYPEFKWTTYEAGSNKSTHPGLRVGCFFDVENADDGTMEVWFGDERQSEGQVHKMNSGDNDNGDSIHFEMITRPYAMGQPLVIKLYKNMQMMAQASDNSYSLEICTIYNMDGIVDNCQSLTLPATGSFWALNADPEDDDNWADDPAGDDFVWAGDDIDPLTYHAHKKAHFQQFRFRQLDADAPVAIFGWGTSGSIFGPIVRADTQQGEQS